jgi:hypothetical protein
MLLAPLLDNAAAKKINSRQPQIKTCCNNNRKLFSCCYSSSTPGALVCKAQSKSSSITSHRKKLTFQKQKNVITKDHWQTYIICEFSATKPQKTTGKKKGGKKT